MADSKSVMLHFRVTEAEAALVAKVTEARDLSVSDLMREALRSSGILSPQQPSKRPPKSKAPKSPASDPEVDALAKKLHSQGLPTRTARSEARKQLGR